MGEQAAFVHGRAYQHELPGVPIDGLRGERILVALAREGLLGADAVIRPQLASLTKLERVHASEYIARLHDAAVIEATFGLTLPRYLIEQVVDLQRYMTGGTIAAARFARRRRKLAVNLGGGFHHAQRDRGRGFCLINDIAVAIAELRRGGFAEPIAVIDLDIHDGDGTRAMFRDDASVWTFSIHNEDWGPPSASSSTSIALGADVGDARYLDALREQLPAVLDRHRPRLVFYLAGCDPSASDSLGNWQISDAGMLGRDRYVIEQLHARGIESLVWLLGGGYGSGAWRHSARALISILGGPRDPRLPSTELVTLTRYRHLAKIIDPRELSGHAPGELVFEESDLLGASPHAGREHERVLGYYTRAGVEFALERYGLLPRLRGLGFDPHVDISCGGETGETVRVLEGGSERLVLVELRVARDRQTIASVELLRIEWLLLQNPRASWVAGRTPLPGQRHPGLHMFEEVALLMLIVCERLGLAGLVVVPSHYHVASRWHGREIPVARRGWVSERVRPAKVLFLDPVVEGRFRALERVLDPLPLAEASTAVERGRVVDRRTGDRRSYVPAPLIMPATGALAARFDERWAEAASAAEREVDFELEP